MLRSCNVRGVRSVGSRRRVSLFFLRVYVGYPVEVVGVGHPYGNRNRAGHLRGTAGRRWSCPRVAALFALCCVGVFVWQIVRFALKTRQNGRKTGVFGRIMPRNRAILRVLDLNFACFKTFFALKSKFFECWTTPKTAVHLHQMPKKQNPHQKKHLTRVKSGGVWVLALPFSD